MCGGNQKTTPRHWHHAGRAARSDLAGWLAKEVASLDVISGGRVEFGIGYGWNVEEMRNHGLDFKKRREILREHILLMKELWTKEEAEFSGKHVKFEKSWAWPKPIQKPHPNVIMGAPLVRKQRPMSPSFATAGCHSMGYTMSMAG